MKSPTIYHFPNDQNWYVNHSDYAALVQQGIRDHGDWRSKLNFLETDYKAEVARLTAENERLRKAGGAMMVRLLLAYGGVADSTIEEWNNAKEGSDAK